MPKLSERESVPPKSGLPDRYPANTLYASARSTPENVVLANPKTEKEKRRKKSTNDDFSNLVMHELTYGTALTSLCAVCHQREADRCQQVIAAVPSGGELSSTHTVAACKALHWLVRISLGCKEGERKKKRKEKKKRC